MEKRVFTENVKVRYSEIDFDLVLKPSVLLHFLQDIASDNAENLGFGYSYITKKNLAWFLLKYRMEFEDYPEKVYDMRITTEPRGYNKLFAFRNFGIYNGEKLLGRVSSTWALVDVVSKNLIPIADAFDNNPYMPPYIKREDDLAFEKIRPLEQVNIEKVFEIRYDDIDVNKHANNANYIVWAFEPLDFQFRSTKKLKSLDMIFKKEIKYGEKVLSRVEIQNDKTNHLLMNAGTGEDLCLVTALWTDK